MMLNLKGLVYVSLLLLIFYLCSNNNFEYICSCSLVKQPDNIHGSQSELELSGSIGDADGRNISQNLKFSKHAALVTRNGPNMRRLLDDTQSIFSEILTTTSTTTKQPLSVSTSTIAPANDDELSDGLCSLTTVTRRPMLNLSGKSEVIERMLNCTGVNERNYHQMVKSIYKRNKLNIQQIHITNSGSLVVFSAIDLICDRFNCSKLTVFNVSGQEIHDYNVLSTWLASWPQLEILDLSNTSLRSIESILPAESRPPIILGQLTSLNLDGNDIVELDFNFLLAKMPELRRLSLQNNSIFNITCNESLKSKVRSQLESISLAGNAINCEKEQLWFMKQFQNPITNLKFPDYDQIKCNAPDRLIEMTWSQRISVLETKICDVCDCRSLKRPAISVDCHNRNLTSLPDILPLNTKILNLTSNRIESISVPQNSRNWENVTYVYLEDNLLSSFQFEMNSRFMRNLAALDIRKNKFQEFPSDIFEQFTHLDQVHLSDNPWLCDCEPAFTFQEWLQRQFQKVTDKEEIKCGIAGEEENGLRSKSLAQRLSGRVIYRLAKSELCPQDNVEGSYNVLDIVNVVLFVCILLVISKATMDSIYQHRTNRLPQFFKLNI